jgi:hypothetical protein
MRIAQSAHFDVYIFIQANDKRVDAFQCPAVSFTGKCERLPQWSEEAS